MEWSALDGLSQVSVNRRMLQFLMSRSHAKRKRRSSTFSSFRDWTLATRILGKGGLCTRALRACFTPSRLPLGLLLRGCWAALFRISAGSERTQTSEGLWMRWVDYLMSMSAWELYVIIPSADNLGASLTAAEVVRAMSASTEDWYGKILLSSLM